MPRGLLRAAHGPSLDNARNRLFWFLCGWMGGPDHYVSQFGHPRLRMRHMPYPIGSKERDQWVLCMGRAMQDTGVDAALPGTSSRNGRPLESARTRTRPWTGSST